MMPKLVSSFVLAVIDTALQDLVTGFGQAPWPHRQRIGKRFRVLFSCGNLYFISGREVLFLDVRIILLVFSLSYYHH